MIDRISLMATGLGLRPEEPGCRPNIIIAATNDGPVVATGLANEMESDMRPVLGVSDKGRAAFQSFQTSEAPVRWRHVSLPYEVDTGAVALGMVGVRQVSRIRATTREDRAWVSVILDVEKIGKVPFGALSDYVGMVVLTQADPDADMTDYDTILNLFATKQRSAVMSQWDRDYLAALYTARRDRLLQSSLNRDVASRLVEASGDLNPSRSWIAPDRVSGRSIPVRLRQWRRAHRHAMEVFAKVDGRRAGGRTAGNAWSGARPRIAGYAGDRRAVGSRRPVTADGPPCPDQPSARL